MYRVRSTLFISATQRIEIYNLRLSDPECRCGGGLQQNVSKNSVNLFCLFVCLLALTVSFPSRWQNRIKSPFHQLLSLFASGHLATNTLFTLFLLSVSALNYPGGSAISRLHRHARNETNISVHVSNLAAQTGVTRFTEINEDWRFTFTPIPILSSSSSFKSIVPFQIFEGRKFKAGRPETVRIRLFDSRGKEQVFNKPKTVRFNPRRHRLHRSVPSNQFRLSNDSVR